MVITFVNTKFQLLFRNFHALPRLNSPIS